MKLNTNRIDRSVNFNERDRERINYPAYAAEFKQALLHQLSAEYADVSWRLVYQAVNEADALASLTSVPLLVLPTLAEEKVQKAAAWSAHQQAILRADSMSFAA
jgi:hypothetical protein